MAALSAVKWKKFLCLFAQEHPDLRLQVSPPYIHAILTMLQCLLHVQELLSVASVSKCQMKCDHTTYSNTVQFLS